MNLGVGNRDNIAKDCSKERSMIGRALLIIGGVCLVLAIAFLVAPQALLVGLTWLHRLGLLFSLSKAALWIGAFLVAMIASLWKKLRHRSSEKSSA
jgi:hypothetical protein